MSFVHPLTTWLFVTTRFGATKKPVPDNMVSGSLATGPFGFGGCSRTQVTTARMAAALSFMSTLANNAPLSTLISTLDASAMLFMNSTDASVVDRILLSPDVENVYGQGLVVGQSVTSDNRISFLFPIQAFHLELEIKITQALSVPLWIWTI